MAGQAKRAWYLGNTTVRNPRRLKEGLRVLVHSPLHGNLVGKKREQQFAKLLHEQGVVAVKRLQIAPQYGDTDEDASNTEEKDASDVGRKWRAALMQLGFITPGPDLSNQPYTITPNGQRLLNAGTLPEEQDCFLRALLALQLPSQIESYIDVAPFNPLRIVLEVLVVLERAELASHISQDEMASIVQFVTRLEDIPATLQLLADFRENAKKAPLPKRFLKERLESAAQDTQARGRAGQSEETLKDYADSNFRYLKLTGLFAESGRRLRLSDYKRTIINQIVSVPYTPVTTEKYLETLWNGAALPTDNTQKAIEAIQSTANILKHKAGTQSIESLVQLALVPDLTQIENADLSQLRFKLEDDLFKLLELDFAKEQHTQQQDIVAYLQALIKPDKHLIPAAEAPAYFEWALWRAFLAINSLANKPWEARRFRIDEEFKPINTAPGNGPDMIFEFEDFVVVVEVTLTASSRQEAVEGEPVRRHIADIVNRYEAQKQVFGLFIANRIDTNTAETFRNGSWYKSDDSHVKLQIVPFTLKQFTDLFSAGFQQGAILDYQRLKEIIIQCLNEKTSVYAPEWKERINTYISKTVKKMQKGMQG